MKKGNKVATDTMMRTVDAMFNQNMKQKRANEDVHKKMAQKMVNTGSPFKSTPKRMYQKNAKVSWA